ncbi:MAG: inorganic phosphate transporter [Chloroflexi bacterium]|nr:inorganic phosphate transporter [Chloroflexota bacterium]
MIVLSAWWGLWLLVGLTLLFNFLNGFHDASNMVATVISTRALSPRAALTWIAFFEFLGPYVLGVAVAKTIGADIVSSQHITVVVLYSALLAAIIWNLVTWYFGIPSSSSHALIGGIVGSVAMASGFGVIKPEGMEKVLIALFTSPVLGFIVGYLLMKLALALLWWATPSINKWFRYGQLVTSAALALSHGANDGQKGMGIIALGLLTLGYLHTFTVPGWVIVASSVAMALGAYSGGWRLIHTIGAKFYRIRPLHGFLIQLTSASIIIGAALLGGPVSTTQVVSAAVVGVGSGERMSKVRWHVAWDIVMTWVLTIPITMALGALFYWLIAPHLSVYVLK